MPVLTILDETGASLLSTDLKKPGIGRYIQGALNLRSGGGARDILKRPLADGFKDRELALTAEHAVPIGTKNELSLDAGASVTIGFRGAGGELFDDADLQSPVEVPPGTAYIVLTLEAHLKAGLSAQGTIGFAFSAGTAVRYTYCHPFDVVAASPTVKEGIATALKHAVFPADVADLAALLPGAFVSMAGEGTIAFKGEATLSATPNVLATPGLPIVGVAQVAQSASVTASASWNASGELELRAAKRSVAELGVAIFKRRGRSLSIGATASMGVSADVRGSDPIAALMRAISSDPEADLLALVDAGLSDESIESIQEAIAASIDRSLTVSAQFEMSRRRDTEALFAYDVDLPRLGERETRALERALRGELTEMDDVADGNGPVRLVTSSARQLRERKSSWRINLLGLVNVASFAQLVQEGSLTFEPASGSLTAADRVTAKRIRVDARPLESRSEKLREVLFQSLMVTAAYRASGALGTSMSLQAGQVYLEQHGRAKRAQVERHYRLLIGLGLCDEQERDDRLGAEHDFETTTFMVENRFDEAACDAMFFAADGQPHPREHFELIGRRSFLALVPASDPGESFRRLALEPDTTWDRVRNLGGDVAPALPVHIRTNPLHLARVNSDVVTIVWWASAMQRAGQELAAMRKFIAGRSAESLASDPAFGKARQKLSDALGGVVSTTKALFDDPWDVLAMEAAALGKGSLEAAIISTRFAVRYSDREDAAGAPARALTRGRAVPAAARGRTEPARDWTDAEVAIFSRHVVNMRNGKLSTDGSFVSTPEQVRAIFETSIPAYVERQKANGAVSRVMFYSHGGLVGEREGLLPILARHRFWELNGIYPVYFVWETGLSETLSDILGVDLRRTRAARAPITDAAIEAGARQGKIVWEQMKTSAENAAGTGGGSRLTAECAGRLWGDLKGEIEFHALGHSAGSIIHAFFLPLLLAQRPQGAPPISVRTLHFLAPAATIDLFKTRLQKLIGKGKPITELVTYTMTDELERADRSMRPYGKSLLYLVRNAFEPKASMAIVGMQDSLKHDLDLIRFFGLAGREQVADIVFSKTAATAPLTDRSESITHGGFDNDVATMTSVVRRVLGVPSEAVVDYFEETISGFDREGVGTPPAAAGRARAGGDRAITQRPWTVMVWLVGEQDGERILEDLKRVDVTGGAHVIAQWERGSETQRYRLRSDTRLEQDVVSRLGATTAGDPLMAADFFRWAIEEYPGERVLAIVSTQGNGPLLQTATEQGRKDGRIALDGTPDGLAGASVLKQVFAGVKRETGRAIDMLVLDGVATQAIELAHELKGLAGLVVGSADAPAGGWSYDRLLESIAANPGVSNAALGAAFQEQAVDSSSRGREAVSSLNTAALDSTVAAVAPLAKALTKGLGNAVEYAAVTRSVHATQRAGMPDYVDLEGFCRELLKRSKSAAVKQAARGALETLERSDGADGRAAAGKQKGRRGHRAGVTIYFPRGPVSKAYAQLGFARVSGWGRFLQAYHNA